jgi:hypothetical protein
MTNPTRSISRHMASGLLSSLVLFAVIASGQEKTTAKGDNPRYKDASLPIQDRVADLLPRMTLEEKT